MPFAADIESHRRDPDPHPRLERQLRDLIAAQTGAGVAPSAAPPTAVSATSGAVGTSLAYARADHAHPLVIPPDLNPARFVLLSGVFDMDDGEFVYDIAGEAPIQVIDPS